MDIKNPIIQLCLEGSRAEFERRLDDARLHYQRAWDARTDDYEACIAAHYLARFQDSAEASLRWTLRWNQAALDYADKVKDERVKEFYPSLYLCLGRSHEVLGDLMKAQRYYHLAAELGTVHQEGGTSAIG